MSSHREAPEISKDPVADSTDIYAFVSPDRPDTVTIISQLHPARGSGRRSELLRVRRRRARTGSTSTTTATARADVIYEFRFTTEVRNPDTFLYNTGPIDTHRQRQLEPAADLHRHRGPRRRSAGCSARTCRARRATSGRARPRTTPRSPHAAITDVGDGIKVFAGQRLDGFYVDLGSVFDLGALRPFQNLHLIPTPGRRPASTRCARSTCTRIAIQVPISS